MGKDRVIMCQTCDVLGQYIQKVSLATASSRLILLASARRVDSPMIEKGLKYLNSRCKGSYPDPVMGK